MHDKEVILIIRRDRDYWRNDHINLQPKYLEIMKFWDLSFKIKIIDYRNKLRDIASSLYLKNKFDKIFLYSSRDARNISVSDEERNIYKNSILVATDEDDWLDPSLSNILRNIKTDKNIIVWNCFKTIKTGQVNSNKHKENTRFVQSCSWAAVGYNDILNHRNNLYIKLEEYSNLYFIDKPLSVKVEHIGSVGFLRKIIKNFSNDKWIDNLIIKLLEDIKIEIDLPEEFVKTWKMYKDLLKDLLSSYKYLTDEHKKILEEKII